MVWLLFIIWNCVHYWVHLSSSTDLLQWRNCNFSNSVDENCMFCSRWHFHIIIIEVCPLHSFTSIFCEILQTAVLNIHVSHPLVTLQFYMHTCWQVSHFDVALIGTIQIMGASNVECDDLASIEIRTYLLTKESMLPWSHLYKMNTFAVAKLYKLIHFTICVQSISGFVHCIFVQGVYTSRLRNIDTSSIQFIQNNVIWDQLSFTFLFAFVICLVWPFSLSGVAVTEKVVGWGISHHLQKMTEPVLRNNKLLIDAERSVSECFFAFLVSESLWLITIYINRVDDTSVMNISVYTDVCITQFAPVLKIVGSLKSNFGRNSVYLGATIFISLFCSLPLVMVALLSLCESWQGLGDTTPLVLDVAPLCASTNS